ncbi:MAG: hypothetical protein NXH75_10700, partial [Halobacteriovoraceae bacterium]|nr:hypothetical protein [Halobacteriovoraceae bacterium]
MKSNIFELFTHSSWVVRNYEIFWIVYLSTLWIIPDVILYLDPYALSIIPLIAILEMGYNFLNILVEILAYFFTKVLRGRRIELFFVLIGLPFLLGGLYLLFSSGSYFTFLIYLFLIVTNIKEYFTSSEVEGSKIFIKDTFAAFGKLIIFFLSTLFIM